MRSLLSLFLLAASCRANLLRSRSNNVVDIVEEAPRNLQQMSQLNLATNQIAFVVKYEMVMPPSPVSTVATPEDNEAFREATHVWLIDELLAPQLSAGFPGAAPGEFQLNVYFAPRGCNSFVLEGSRTPSDAGDIDVLAIRYTCQMQGTDAPWPLPPLLNAMEMQAGNKQAELEQAVLLSGSTLYAQFETIYTTSLPLTWVSVGNQVRNDNFNNSYVLPFVITWSLTTPPDFADQTEYDATRNATKVWIEQNWDEFYGAASGYPGGDDFARVTVDVQLRYSEFMPRAKLYQQGVALGVEILIGADNITHVPSVESFLERMQLYYPISNFTATLDSMLPPSALFRNRTQTTYALLPTFPVMTLEQSKFRDDDKPGNGRPDVINFATVSVDLTKAAAANP